MPARTTLLPVRGTTMHSVRNYTCKHLNVNALHPASRGRGRLAYLQTDNSVREKLFRHNRVGQHGNSKRRGLHRTPVRAEMGGRADVGGDGLPNPSGNNPIKRCPKDASHALKKHAA
jgi:hypothetical protein